MNLNKEKKVDKLIEEYDKKNIETQVENDKVTKQYVEAGKAIHKRNYKESLENYNNKRIVISSDILQVKEFIDIASKDIINGNNISYVLDNLQKKIWHYIASCKAKEPIILKEYLTDDEYVMIPR